MTAPPSAPPRTTPGAPSQGDGSLRVGVDDRFARPRRTPDLSRRLRDLAGRAAGPLAVLVLWWVATTLEWISPILLPSPTSVWAAFVELAQSGSLADNLLVSLGRAGTGLLIGVVVGVLLALVTGLSRVGEVLIDSNVQMLRAMPILALQPLVIVWFGIGEPTKILLVALAVTFPVYINTHAAIRSVDVRLIELAATLELSRPALVRRVVLPGALPGFLTGLRFATAVSWLVLVVAEQINATAGIGYLMTQARTVARTDIIIVGLVVYALLGLLSDIIVRTIEKEVAGMGSHAPGSLTVVPALVPDERPVVVDAEGIARTFDGRGVLHDITLQIRRGEFVALLGRSGSGKSTLLRILAQLDRDHSGRLVVPERRAVAFQDSRLLPWAKVLPNVLLGLKDSRSRRRGTALLEEVGLADRANAWPKTLSGGEQQRAALARALARDPELLLMDEPFGALDALTRIRMHRLLRGLVTQHSPAVLLVTHDVDEAVLLADRVIVLTDGRLSLDERIDLPTVGRRAHPDFGRMRSHLLTELGVGDDDH